MSEVERTPEQRTPWHEVIQGDCLDVLRGMESESIDAVITDPPYGLDYQSARRTDKAARLRRIDNDARPFIWWLYDAFRVAKQDSSLVCFTHWRVQDFWLKAIEAAGWNVRSQVIWDRECHGMGDVRTLFAPRHDVIWFATKGKFKFPNGRPPSVLRAARVSPQSLVHPAEKPVGLMQELASKVCVPGGTVLDPFCGSGSTGKACVREGLGFVGIELDAEYAEIARRNISFDYSVNLSRHERFDNSPTIPLAVDGLGKL